MSEVTLTNEPVVLDSVIAQSRAVDAQHEVMQQLLKDKADLQRKLDVFTKPAEPVATVPGGKPIPHHLHLVDGRVVTNHEGIGTHFSEMIDAGDEMIERVTRIAAHYPANEIHPAKKFA